MVSFPLNGITYSTKGDGSVRTGDESNSYGGSGFNSASVTIPNSVCDQSGNTFKVTEVGKNSFYSFGYIISVFISASVVIIDDGAFQGCGSITSITIESTSKLEYIGYAAFANSPASIIIPASVKTIGLAAFIGQNYEVHYCGTTEITNQSWNYGAHTQLYVTETYKFSKFGGCTPTGITSKCIATRTPQITPFQTRIINHISCPNKKGSSYSICFFILQFAIESDFSS